LKSPDSLREENQKADIQLVKVVSPAGLFAAIVVVPMVAKSGMRAANISILSGSVITSLRKKTNAAHRTYMMKPLKKYSWKS